MEQIKKRFVRLPERRAAFMISAIVLFDDEKIIFSIGVMPRMRKLEGEVRNQYFNREEIYYHR
eukprot:scaffold9455_cov54-Attheya_sp.AAC.4